MTAITLSGGEAAGLSAYLEHVLDLDDRAAVRVQAEGSVAGVWSGPPFGVLALRPVALSAPAHVDATVSARRLRNVLGDGSPGAGARPVSLPPAVVGPAWVAQLPPRTGWERRATVPAMVVADQVAVAVEGFRRRVDALPEGERSREAMERIADDVWGAPSVADLPLRAAHAAIKLGLVGRDGEVSASAAGDWRRLACPGGSVAWRRGGTASVLDLAVILR